MKRIYNYLLSAAVLTLSALTLTSCDDDVDMAMTLSGEWTGDFGMYYGIEDRRTGQWIEFDADRTDLVFYPDHDYATHGEGKQVDFYSYGPYRYQYYYFYWEVRNGVLYMDYPYDSNLNVAISDYRMSDRLFSGRIGNTKFTLYKIKGYYDWGNYHGDYYGDYDDGYWYDYYSKSRDGKSDVSVDASELNMRRGNRMNETQN